MLDKVIFLYYMLNDFIELIIMDDCVNLNFDINLY